MVIFLNFGRVMKYMNYNDKIYIIALFLNSSLAD